MNLTDFGLQRHRVLWDRKMDEEAIPRTGESGSTIDQIEIAEFDSHVDLLEWLGKTVPAFFR